MTNFMQDAKLVAGFVAGWRDNWEYANLLDKETAIAAAQRVLATPSITMPVVAGVLIQPSKRAECSRLLVSLLQKHSIADDSWYTCPLAIKEQPDNIEARCSDDSKIEDGNCYCGASANNQRVRELANFLGVELPT